jgi:translation elongation factor EF-Tu-like GTPase
VVNELKMSEELVSEGKREKSRTATGAIGHVDHGRRR